jgi:hypothetical protein
VRSLAIARGGQAAARLEHGEGCSVVNVCCVSLLTTPLGACRIRSFAAAPVHIARDLRPRCQPPPHSIPAPPTAPASRRALVAFAHSPQCSRLSFACLAVSLRA